MEETFEILVEFQGEDCVSVDDMDERVECAYKLLSAVELKRRGKLLCVLYEKVVESDAELLGEIAESRAAGEKTDAEINELVKKTSLFKLVRMQEDGASLTSKEYGIDV